MQRCFCLSHPRKPTLGSLLAATAGLVVFATGSMALGQVNCDDQFAEHGAGATKACSNRCLGETMSCTSTFFNLDGFSDSLQLVEAFDTVDGSIRVPAAGNLPIIAVLGNAVCTNSGGTCTPATGVNCAFPCLVCTAGTSDSHGGLTCPGLIQAGSVRVRQSTHVITHTGATTDTISFVYTDNCDSGCANCPTTELTTPAASNTNVPNCADTDPCNIDCCAAGVCSHPSSCVGTTCRDVNGNVTVFPPLTCGDSNVCTSDICINDTNLATECCDNPPIPCPERTCFDLTGCDPSSGCQYTSECTNPNRCNDNDVCTSDICDETLGDCCDNPIIPCPDRACFTTTGCNPITGCQYTSVCTDVNRCNDNNVCTADVCDETVTGCCTNTPIPCEERECFDVTCDPVDGCIYTDNGTCHGLIGCRITGGRFVLDGEIVADPNGIEIIRGQGGGQVGAPCGCIGCFDTFDHIQGQWQYSRKKKQGSFHASEFNSLICGCDETSPECNTNGVPGSGFAVAGNFSGDLCNPGDREPGPEPRRSPANVACFSGIGGWTETNGRRETLVAFRVEVEDRGEPAVGPNSDDTCDVYQIRIWIPGPGETAAGLADQVCCIDGHDTIRQDVRRPDIQDGGNLVHGNLQIHPQTPNSQDGTCPIPDGSCQQP